MPLEPITFDCGHQLVDNGTGDYCLQCPDGHKARPTIFPHTAASMVHNPDRWECLRCDQRLGAHTAGEMFRPLPMPDPLTCEHVVGFVRSKSFKAHPGHVERTVLFNCGKCGWNIEDVSQFYPGMPGYDEALAQANGGGDGRG